MKVKFLTGIIIPFLFVSSVIYSQNVSIPDSAFKAALVSNLALNLNMDGEIQVAEATAYTGSIVVQGLGITDVTGIEAFTSLNEFDCRSNAISTLDVTQNIALTTLYCSENQLTSINLSQNIFLEYFACDSNNISTLDLSNCPNLITLFALNNQLNTVTGLVSPVMTSIYLLKNNLTSLDLSQLGSSMSVLQCEHNNLMELDVSNLSNLYWLTLEFNQISTLDIQFNPAMLHVGVNDNKLISLDLRNGNNASLTVGATNNPDLTCVNVDDPTWSDTAWSDRNFGPFRSADLVSFSNNCGQFSTLSGSNIVCGLQGVTMVYYPEGNTGYSYEWLKGGVSLGATTLDDSIRTVYTTGSYQVVVDDGFSIDTMYSINIRICDSLASKIEGYVFIDLDSNGIMNGPEVGLGGIKVQLLNGDYDYSNQIGYFSLRSDTGVFTLLVDTPTFYGCNNRLALTAIGSSALLDTLIIVKHDSIYTMDGFGFFEPDFRCGKVCGHVFLDSNENGVEDVGEGGYAGINIKISPGGMVQTDANGDYCMEVAYGVQVTVDLVPGLNLYYCARPHSKQSFPQGPNNYQVTVAAGGPNSVENDFGIYDLIQHDVGIYTLRTCFGNISGLDFSAWMDYKSIGEPNPDSCYLTVTYDDTYIDDLGGHSRNPVDFGPGYVTWGFGPGETPSLDCMRMNFHVDSSAEVGDTLLWEAEYSCFTPDLCPNNNQKHRSVIVQAKNKNGYDFYNDMQVYLQDEEASLINTDTDSTLSYVINFQNVGLDSVFYIRIVDTLPAELNVETISLPFGTIPTAKFYITDDNVLIWESKQVAIPGSVVDYLNSYGFVQYDIILKEALPAGTVIENSASIMYNYNLDKMVTTPVTQVLVTNTLGMKVLAQSENVMVFPNPSEGMVNIQLDAGIQNASIELFDITGRSIYRNEDLSSGISTINLSEFDKGIYIYRISDSSTGLVIGSGKLGLD